MKEKLHRLVYISKNQITGEDEYISKEIQQILDAARVNNSHENVTGALMFNSGVFAQVLEGPHDSVQKVFESIQCDERHCDVVILEFAPVSERGFGSWSMAYVGSEQASNEKLLAIAESTGFTMDSIPAERVFEALREYLYADKRLAS